MVRLGFGMLSLASFVSACFGLLSFVSHSRASDLFAVACLGVVCLGLAWLGSAWLEWLRLGWLAVVRFDWTWLALACI